jgi:hypothetical protein
MTTPERFQIAHHIAAIVLFGTLAVCAVILTRKVQGKIDLDAVNTTTTKLNKPCKGSGDDKADNCGTIGLINQAFIKGGDAIVTTQQQEQTLIKQTTPILTSLATIPGHVDGTMDALTGTAQTASRSLQDATDHLTPVLDAATSTTLDVGTATRRLLPIEDDADASVKHFDALVTSKDITRFLNSTAVTSEQVAGIATDLHKATTDATKPQPWWRKALGYGNLGVNIACLATHSCPF